MFCFILDMLLRVPNASILENVNLKGAKLTGRVHEKEVNVTIMMVLSNTFDQGRLWYGWICTV